MKAKILNIFSILMIFTFAITIVGVNINYHICGDSGNESVELYFTPNCECENGTDSNIPDSINDCAEQSEDCCSGNTDPNAIPIEKAFANDCCYSFSKTFAINDEFLTSINNLDKLFTVNPQIISDFFEIKYTSIVTNSDLEVKNIIFLPRKALIRSIHLASFKGISNPDDFDNL